MRFKYYPSGMLDSKQSKVARVLIRWLIEQGLTVTDAKVETVSLLNKYEVKDIEASFPRVNSLGKMKTFLYHRTHKKSETPKFNQNGVQIA